MYANVIAASWTALDNVGGFRQVERPFVAHARSLGAIVWLRSMVKLLPSLYLRTIMIPCIYSAVLHFRLLPFG